MVGNTVESPTMHSSNTGGGAVMSIDGGGPLLSSCTLVGNWVQRDGIVHSIRGQVGPVLTNCVVTGNWVEGAYGTIFNRGRADAALVNCTIGSNAGPVSSGYTRSVYNFASWSEDVNVWATNCLFFDGAPESQAGYEAWCARGSGSLTAINTITNCLFDDEDMSTRTVGGDPVTWTATDVVYGEPTFTHDADPITGTWSNVTTWTQNGVPYTTLSDPLGAYGDMAGMQINPDTSALKETIIVSNTASSIVVYGDFDTVSGATYLVKDYRLYPNSVGVDAGTATGAPSHDMIGTARPQGGGVDIGAFERIPGGEVRISPRALAFGSQHVEAGPSTAKTVGIYNDGESALTFTGSGSTLLGATTEYDVTGTLSGSLATGTSTSLSVAFDPTSVGSKSATLRVLTDDGDEPGADVPLSGTGVFPKMAVENWELF
jgi:hypothetical protein